MFSTAHHKMETSSGTNVAKKDH
jgi:hypothetical protein